MSVSTSIKSIQDIMRKDTGVDGDPSSAGNKSKIDRANAVAALRQANRPLEVKFFDAASASVWT